MFGTRAEVKNRRRRQPTMARSPGPGYKAAERAGGDVQAQYQRFRLAWRANRAARRASRLGFGEVEIPLLRHIVPPRVSLDVGANKGVYSWLLLPLSRAVVAFEPNPLFHVPLAAALGERARVIPKACADASGPRIFRIPKSPDGAPQPNVGGLVERPDLDCEWVEMKVEATTIDDEAIADVGFIKIDTEGAELDVIRGALRTIERDRPALLIEINDKETERAGALESLLRERDYAIVDYAARRIRIVPTIVGLAGRNVIFLPLERARDGA